MEPTKHKEKSSSTVSTQRLNAQFSSLNRISAIISQSEGLENALDRTLDQILELTGADIGSVHLIEPNNRDQLNLISTRGASKGFIYAEKCIPVRECICGKTACTGQLISSPNLAVEPRLERTACRDEQFGSLISIPLKSLARVLGVFTIYAKRPYAFSDIDEDFLILLGRYLGVAIENAQLYAQTRELAIMEQRGLIAQEIHDGVAQSLAYLNLETVRMTKRMKRFLRNMSPVQCLPLSIPFQK